MNNRGRSKWEIFVVVVVVALAIVVGVGLYASKSKVFNGKRMITELSAIRSAVTLYTTLNKELPPDLEMLTKSTYNAGKGEKRVFLDKITTDASGKLIDPFGKPYQYDSTRGFVSSSSVGYEKW